MSISGTVNSPKIFYILHVEDMPEEVSKFRDAIYLAMESYGIDKQCVDITEAKDAKAAGDLLTIAKEDRPDRVFDAIICDLGIPREPGGVKDQTHGLRVIAEAGNLDICGSIICLSNFASDADVLKTKDQEFRDVRIDEWLDKGRDTINMDVLVAKLRRCLIPVEYFAMRLNEGDSPLVFRDVKMKTLLRELVYLACRPYVRWPLARILLLGDPGTGKGALARAFYRILPTLQTGARGKFVRLNSASAVSEGHGGRIALFGAEGFGTGVADQPGIFERASEYPSREPSGLAALNVEPIPDRAGVVFLDEFAELSPELQASILNALEEGEVRREGSGRTVKICCHVVFATNCPIESLQGTPDQLQEGWRKLREDLMDRIPNILYVPSLNERREEVPEIVIRLATAQLRVSNPNAKTVEITESAVKLMDRAIMGGVLRSVRQLQMIADVLPGESRISDGNLRSLFARASILGQEINIKPEEQSLDEKLSTLRFTALFGKELPKATQEIIDRLFRANRNFAEMIDYNNLELDADHAIRLALATELLTTSEIKPLLKQSIDAFRQWKSRLLGDHDVPARPQNATKKALRDREEWVIKQLLSDKILGIGK